ncbi:hypothetical protein NPIL_397101 [Nephila pilipes]|uniref:Uncharacterized protein n=1 Tax=Nephila pilipes TaxID=299642 RepID=A0A8X6MTB4_NEPPI|nr:hypothetical protein NPIL_397101 [Nephila pilipes]
MDEKTQWGILFFYGAGSLEWGNAIKGVTAIEATGSIITQAGWTRRTQEMGFLFFTGGSRFLLEWRNAIEKEWSRLRCPFTQAEMKVKNSTDAGIFSKCCRVTGLGARSIIHTWDGREELQEMGIFIFTGGSRF